MSLACASIRMMRMDRADDADTRISLIVQVRVISISAYPHIREESVYPCDACQCYMWLQEIEIIGFKSFANKSTLEFLPPTTESRGITAIVGPNGSGKSCVVDSIRWVLGEQSMKLLRGKRAEDVIFAGTPKRPRLGVAEVTLTLNNEDGSAPIDYAEVVIGRRVYRSGESEYFLNGTKVRREDIILLLAKARIGQRTYSIIGQGMIDAFLIASPADRKGFFDEAAGIRPAEIKRDHAVAKLEQAEENLRQGETLLQEIAPRLRSLTRQVKRLERREEVERELHALLEQYYGSRWHELIEAMERARGSWQAADGERQRLQASVDAIQAKIATLERQETKGDAFLPLQREYEALVDRRQDLREKLLVLRGLAERTVGDREVLPAAALLGDIDAVLGEFDEFLTTLRIVDHLDDTRPTIERLVAIHGRIGAIRKRCAPETTPTPPPELRDTEVALRAIEEKLADVQRRMAALHEEERRRKGVFFDLQRQYREQQLALNGVHNRANDLRIELARLEQRRDDLQQEIVRDLGAERMPDGLPKPTASLPPETPERIMRLQRELAIIGTLDEQTLNEFRETEERATFLERQTTDLRKSITTLREIIVELDRDIDRAFHESFAAINAHFEQYFRQLFGGGSAKLILLHEEPNTDENKDENADVHIPDIPPVDRLSAIGYRLSASISGIEIQATPPGKRIKHIAMLSGGERALTAIALLCAIISASQSPFVILDEVDAALDESNSVRFAEILKDLSRHTQFLVVTHNRYTMERAAMIYGITMGDDGASRLLSLKLEEAKIVAA